VQKCILGFSGQGDVARSSLGALRLQISITHPGCTVTCPSDSIRDDFVINKFNFFENPPFLGPKPPQNANPKSVFRAFSAGVTVLAGVSIHGGFRILFCTF
jgi:hypothetical protein